MLSRRQRRLLRMLLIYVKFTYVKKVLKCAAALMVSSPGCRPGWMPPRRPGGRDGCRRGCDGCHTREASAALHLPTAQPAPLCSPLQLLYLQ